MPTKAEAEVGAEVEHNLEEQIAELEVRADGIDDLAERDEAASRALRDHAQALKVGAERLRRLLPPPTERASAAKGASRAVR